MMYQGSDQKQISNKIRESRKQCTCLGISCWVLILICVYLIYSFLAQSNVTDSVLEVVAYEARRLFRDRLVSSKDLHTFDNILSSIIRGDWASDALDNMTGMRCLYSRWHTHWFKSYIHIQNNNCLMHVMPVFSGCQASLNKSNIWLALCLWHLCIHDSCLF